MERHPEQWLTEVERRGRATVIDDALSDQEAADEMLLMGLRLREGIVPERYEEMSGLRLPKPQLGLLLEQGLVEFCKEGRLRATYAGRLVLDSVVTALAT
jgi:oxygen-independent coproporphyrinogen-3 oxidase